MVHASIDINIFFQSSTFETGSSSSSSLKPPNPFALLAPNQIMEGDDENNGLFVVGLGPDNKMNGPFVVNDQIDVGNEVELALEGDLVAEEECLLITSSIDLMTTSPPQATVGVRNGGAEFSNLEISTTCPEEIVQTDSGEMDTVNNCVKQD